MRPRVHPPAHFNPAPKFGLRVVELRCRQCDLLMLDNPIVHLGGGVLAKFGLCEFCLRDEMYERQSFDECWRSCDDEPPCYECGGWHSTRICPTCGGIACVSCSCAPDDEYESRYGDEDRDHIAALKESEHTP